MSFGENTQGQPFLIEDAREAQHAASKTQREHGDELAKAYVALAEAEYTYSTAKVARIKQLKNEGWAATVCSEIAKGEESIAHLRRERDKRRGELEFLKNGKYTLLADRRALDGLIDWSKRAALRIDAEPSHRQWDEKTGELRPVGAAA